jgi:HK97 family phage prohead protease
MDALDLGREVRINSGLEIRRVAEVDDHTVRLSGYASVFGVPYDVAGGPDLGGWTETMQRGAFKRTLGMNVNRALLLHHNGERVVATTRAGGLRLSEDGAGLLVDADIDTRVSWLSDLAYQVESGTVDEMSIGFYTRDSSWNRDYTERTVTEVQLIEATLTWAGANGATVSMIERGRNLVAEARAAATKPTVDRARIAARAAIADLGL